MVYRKYFLFHCVCEQPTNVPSSEKITLYDEANENHPSPCLCIVNVFPSLCSKHCNIKITRRISPKYVILGILIRRDYMPRVESMLYLTNIFGARAHFSRHSGAQGVLPGALVQKEFEVLA